MRYPSTPWQARSISLPALVRVKPAALGRLGVYLRRFDCSRVVVLFSAGLPAKYTETVEQALTTAGVTERVWAGVDEGDFETATRLFAAQPGVWDAVIGLGGGKAVDVAKYVAFLGGARFWAVPTSLSSDGFCSPQASLSLAGKRRSLVATGPWAVVVDTEVCLAAPAPLWCAGVGDLAAKLTALADWKLAFHERGEMVEDLAALLSDAAVMQFAAQPTRDLEGVRRLAQALLLNGVAMQVAGSSRPASGSEHLISHALDQLGESPQLHGLQVGVATYLVSLLQGGEQSARIAALFDATGFWACIENRPFSRRLWLQALTLAPQMKANFHTVLHGRDCLPEAAHWLSSDRQLSRCFCD